MPPSTHQQLALADRYFRAGQLRLCEDLLRQLIRRNQAVSKAYELLAYICGNRDQLEACEELLLKAASLPGCAAEAFFYLGKLIEMGDTQRLFTSPREERTEAYITGRFG